MQSILESLLIQAAKPSTAYVATALQGGIVVLLALLFFVKEKTYRKWIGAALLVLVACDVLIGVALLYALYKLILLTDWADELTEHILNGARFGIPAIVVLGVGIALFLWSQRNR